MRIPKAIFCIRVRGFHQVFDFDGAIATLDSPLIVMVLCVVFGGSCVSLVPQSVSCGATSAWRTSRLNQAQVAAVLGKRS